MYDTSDSHIFAKWHEECGIFGIWNHFEAAKISYIALNALQHRGQESAGIATTDGLTMHYHRNIGLVAEVFTQEHIATLPGRGAIGHVRYSTTGSSHLANAQPFVFDLHQGYLALAHNGNLVNTESLRSLLEQEGCSFQSTSDSEVVAQLIIHDNSSHFLDRVRASLSAIEGGYAIVLLTNDKLIAIRDPYGLRPLALGQLGEAFVVASETCAFNMIGATFLRDIEPGEMVIIEDAGKRVERFAPVRPRALCTFEYIYFARPDSNLDGINVYTVRKQLGRALARTCPVDADLVIGVPDSALSAAIGYAEVAGLPYEHALVKNTYAKRTFIQPDQKQREYGVSLKLNIVCQTVEGKRVVVVDDSLIRGTTSVHIVSLIRAAGAREIHMRIAAPPVTHPCFYGIDTIDITELIASQRSISEIAHYIGADSLAFLSEEEMLRAFEVHDPQENPFCNACFTGRYPTTLSSPVRKDMFEINIDLDVVTL